MTKEEIKKLIESTDINKSVDKIWNEIQKSYSNGFNQGKYDPGFDNEECQKCGSNNLDFIGDELKCCDCGHHWIDD